MLPIAMDPNRPVLVILHGPAGDGAAQQTVAAHRLASSRESAARSLRAGFGGVVVATAEPGRAGVFGKSAGIDPDPPGEYAFLTRLQGIVARYRLERPVVMGAGALPLLDEADFSAIAAQLNAADRGALVTNNVFSGDITGWYPGTAIERVSECARDNGLPRRLRDLGLEAHELPRTAATTFDLDTPSDLAVLAATGRAPGAVSPEVMARYRQLMDLLCDRDAEVFVAGRTGSHAWRYLEQQTACRVRLLSEERGLAAAPADHRARSALGFVLERVPFAEFFGMLAELGDAAVLDTRVIEAHFGFRWTVEDRFQADLFAPWAISDSWLRDFTAAAAEAPAPVLLGGHSLVTGGLMALADAAWAERDAARGV
jgi:CTP:molybdopterin cytidylyltransferase MocA